MKNIKGFDSFVISINEDFSGRDASIKYAKDGGGGKAARIISGTAVGYDEKEGAKYPLTALGPKNFNSVVNAWKAGNKDQAAEILRGVIIKERDTQLKMGVAAIMAGIALGSFGIEHLIDIIKEPIVPPIVPPPIVPPGTEYVVKQGDNIWNIGKAQLPEGSSNSVINDYMFKIINANKGIFS